MDSSSLFAAFEAHVTAAVQWIRIIVETFGVAVIALGVGVSLFRFCRALITRVSEDYSPIRLVLAQYLAVGLELQLGADILSTAISPSWTQIGKLGAIAVIRTGLNLFLTREMEGRKGETRHDKETQPNCN